MDKYLSVRPPPPFNKIILALKSINLKADSIKELLEFKLHADDAANLPLTTIDCLQEYLEVSCLCVRNSDSFNVLQYWLDCYKSQPDLA